MAPPVATIEIFLDARDAIHVRINHLVLDPILLTDIETSTFVTRAKEKLNALTESLDGTKKLIRFQENLDEMGLLLGGLLFGRRDMLDGTIDRGAGNKLSEAMAAFHRDACRAHSFVLICFSAEDARTESLPWELAIWVDANGGKVTLGTDRHLAFVRQAHYHGYVEPLYCTDRCEPFKIAHVTSAHDVSSEFYQEHESVSGFFKELGLPEDLVHAQATTSTEWREANEGADLVFLQGHGSRGTLIWDLEPGSLDLGADELASMLGGEPLPRLFVLISCSGFDQAGSGKRGLSWELVQRGAASALGMLGSIEIGNGASFVKILHGELFEHGRLDRAVQNLRHFMRYAGIRAMCTNEVTRRSDFFRPVLFIRDITTLSYFEPLGEERFRSRLPKTRAEDENYAQTLGLVLSNPGSPDAGDHLSRLQQTLEAIQAGDRRVFGEYIEELEDIVEQLADCPVSHDIVQSRTSETDEDIDARVAEIWAELKWKTVEDALTRGMTLGQILEIVHPDTHCRHEEE